MTQTLQSALGITEDTTIQITDLQHGSWGRRLDFVCQAADRRFILRFDDCREQRWQLYTHLPLTENAFPLCQIVDLRLGRTQHRSPAHMLTDYFGLSLVYGTIMLIEGASEQPLA